MGRLPWTQRYDVNFAYAPNWAKGLQFKVDVFNVFNSQKVLSVVEGAENSATGTASVPTCCQRRPVTSFGPLRRLLVRDF